MSPRFSPYSGRSSVSATRSCSLIIAVSFQRVGGHQTGNVRPGIDDPDRSQVRTPTVGRTQRPFDHVPDAEGRRLFLDATVLGGMVQQGFGQLLPVIESVTEPPEECRLRSA